MDLQPPPYPHTSLTVAPRSNRLSDMAWLVLILLFVPDRTSTYAITPIYTFRQTCRGACICVYLHTHQITYHITVYPLLACKQAPGLRKQTFPRTKYDDSVRLFVPALFVNPTYNIGPGKLINNVYCRHVLEQCK